MFERATKAVREVGENVLDSAKNIKNSISTTSKEQGELISMRVQKSTLERKLEEAYTRIGRKYVESIHAEEGESFDVSDILEEIKPIEEKLDEIVHALKEKEIAVKKEAEERRKKKAFEDFEAYKAKLDQALEMDILDQEEYDAKLAQLQKKYDNYDQLRKINLQMEMGIISEEEYNEKINQVLQ